MSDLSHATPPSDNTTMTRVLRELGDTGWKGQFVTVTGGSVRCTNCDTVVPAGDLQVEVERRLEGASDPDDMTLVIAANCPSCGTPSTMVLGYGPAGSDEDGDVVVALQRGDTETRSIARVTPVGLDADAESPGATLDSDTPAEPNEPG